jgi:hypothetical protein
MTFGAIIFSYDFIMNYACTMSNDISMPIFKEVIGAVCYLCVAAVNIVYYRRYAYCRHRLNDESGMSAQVKFTILAVISVIVYIFYNHP